MANALNIKVDLRNFDIAAVRYAAYAVTDEAYAVVLRSGRAMAHVELTPKFGRVSRAGLKKRFMMELADEKLRSGIYDANRELREWLLLKAVASNDRSASVKGNAVGLTPEQEKELDALIKQVEDELKRETAPGARDPLGITKTWEDKHGQKKDAKK